MKAAVVTSFTKELKVRDLPVPQPGAGLASVVAVDIENNKPDPARELGAEHRVNARTGDPVAAIQDLGGADAAICLAVSPQAMGQAFDSLKRGGRLVLVALPRDNELALPIFQTVLKGISVIGSIVGTRLDLAEVFELHAAGRTKVIAAGRKLDDVNACFDEVVAGHVPARLVFEF